jgi:hypothetical protein
MNDRKYFYIPIQAKHLIFRIGFGLLLLVQISLQTQAQSVPFKKEFFLGAKGGMVFSNVKFKPNVDQNLYIGNSAGLIFRMISEPHVGIQIELNYINKGWEEKPLDGQSQSYFHRLNYFDIPVMTHASLGKKAFKFTLNLGPAIAFLLSDSQGMIPASPGIPADPPIQYWGKPIDSGVDFLFVGGLGTEYHSKKAGAIALDARLFYSLTNLYDAKNYAYDPSRTTGFLVTMAYLFKLNSGKK